MREHGGTSIAEKDMMTSTRQMKEVHHGRTPAAWVGSSVALVGFLVMFFGFTFGPHGIPSINIPISVVGGVILLLAPVIGGVMNKIGLGQD